MKKTNKTNLNTNKPTLHVQHYTSQKAITLIALVITIIVMLILVAVTVTVAINGGIFDKARNAKEQTENEKSGEQALATGGVWIDDLWYSSYEAYLNGEQGQTTETPSLNGKEGQQTGTTPGLKVGDVVEYDCITGVDQSLLTYTSTNNGYGEQIFTVTENPEWVVLEIGTNGKVLITPRDPVQSLTLSGQDGYTYGINEIENIAAIYGHGDGAISVRSITIEDINKAEAYTPPIPISYTFTKENDGYIYVNGIKGSNNYTTFYYYENGWKTLNVGESVTLQNTNYFHHLGSTEIENILKRGYYWLASQATGCDNRGYAYFIVRISPRLWSKWKYFFI